MRTSGLTGDAGEEGPLKTMGGEGEDAVDSVL